LGYDDNFTSNYSRTTTFVAPNVVANPTGQWATTKLPRDLLNPSRTKALRISGILANDLFHGRAHSQTSFGGDYIRQDGEQHARFYVLADANFNPVVNTIPTAANNGYTIMPLNYTPMPNGPVQDRLWSPGQKNVTINGQNYTNVVGNEPNPALVSPANPLGLTGRSNGDYNDYLDITKGFYFANITHWLGGRLTTLLGTRPLRQSGAPALAPAPALSRSR
jgi:hypothetical protein